MRSAPASLEVRNGLKADVCRLGDKLKGLPGRARRYLLLCRKSDVSKSEADHEQRH